MRVPVDQRWNVPLIGPFKRVERRIPMTRLFLAAGVAALAIAAPASAKPGGGNGGHGGDRGGAAQFHGGGGRGFEMRGGGRQSFSAPRQQRSFAFQSRGNGRTNVDRNRGPNV